MYVNKKKATLKYQANTFSIIKEGDTFRKFELLERRSSRSLLFSSRSQDEKRRAK
jgi:hypothetical protein